MSNFPRCHSCGDLGFVIEKNTLKHCWREFSTPEHNAPNEAANMLQGAIERLALNNYHFDPLVFEVAKQLTYYTTTRPFDKERSLETHFTMPLRSFMGIIETLRRVWLLPVGSRKSAPTGYWIIVDIDDFKEWVTRFKSAPSTQLATAAELARRNFPILAKQLELEFWQDVHGTPSARNLAA